MSAFRTMRNPRIAGGVRQLVALAAIGTAALGLAQPRVMRLAGLDFAHSPSAARPMNTALIDMAPTGTVKPRPGDASRIHGLAGTLKALRHTIEVLHAIGARSPRVRRNTLGNENKSCTLTCGAAFASVLRRMPEGTDR